MASLPQAGRPWRRRRRHRRRCCLLFSPLFFSLSSSSSRRERYSKNFKRKICSHSASGKASRPFSQRERRRHQHRRRQRPECVRTAEENRKTGKPNGCSLALCANLARYFIVCGGSGGLHCARRDSWPSACASALVNRTKFLSKITPEWSRYKLDFVNFYLLNTGDSYIGILLIDLS